MGNDSLNGWWLTTVHKDDTLYVIQDNKWIFPCQEGEPDTWSEMGGSDIAIILKEDFRVTPKELSIWTD